jgi:hypothetical protein
VRLQIKSPINGFEGGISIKLFWEAGFLLYKKNEKGTFLKQKGPFKETSVLFTAAGLSCVMLPFGSKSSAGNRKNFFCRLPCLFAAGNFRRWAAHV